MLDVHFSLLIISFKLANQQRDKGAGCGFKDGEPSYLLPRNPWVNLPSKKKKKMADMGVGWGSFCFAGFSSSCRSSLLIMQHVASEQGSEQSGNLIIGEAT